jgi:hypothetical protein
VSEADPTGPRAGGGEIRERGVHYQVRLVVDGRELPLKEFLHDLLGGAAIGLVAGLKDAGNPETVHLEVRRNR